MPVFLLKYGIFVGHPKCPWIDGHHKDRKRKITTVAFSRVYIFRNNLEWESLRLLPEIYGPNYSFRPLVSPKIGLTI